MSLLLQFHGYNVGSIADRAGNQVASQGVFHPILGGEMIQSTRLATTELTKSCFSATLTWLRPIATFMLHLFHKPLDHVSVHLKSIDYSFGKSSFFFLQNVGDPIEFYLLPAPSFLCRQL